MAAARPLVTVFSVGDGAANAKPIAMPAVFLAPIRPDIVGTMHTAMNKNKRQAYAVFNFAGHQHSAESWGTGRAVSRIPRVSGGGNSRSGQGAFGNMCRKGRMFAPTKTWRKWHRKTNTNQKRYAVASALAASALPALVMARGHAVDNVPEIPLVADGSLEKVTRTKQAVAALKALGAYADVEKSRDSKKLRRGKGKMRNRRHVQRRGPLIVYNKDEGIVQAFRNLPGVELAQVERLNLLQLAPGGHMGRFIVWTQDAFNRLGDVWGTARGESKLKKGYRLPRARMANSDITRIINSDEVQSKLRAANTTIVRAQHKKNPLKNFGARVKLNPYALALRRSELLAQERRAAKKAANLETLRSGKNPDRDRDEASKIARRKTHKPQQKINYEKLVTGSYDGDAASIKRVSSASQVARGGAPPAAAAMDEKEDPEEQLGDAMDFGAPESKLTKSHDNGGVEVTMSARNLIKMDWLSKSDPCVGLFVEGDNGEYDHYDQTEWKKNNHNPDFDKKFFIPSTLTGRGLKFNVYDVDDDSKVTDKQLMGSIDISYSVLKDASNDGKPLTLELVNKGVTGKKLKKAKSVVILNCLSVGTGFDLPKCLAYTKKSFKALKRKDVDAEDFVDEIEQRWRHLDADESGLVSLQELREAVWFGEADNKGKKVPAKKFPKALQDIVDEIYQGTGSKPEFTYWDFVQYYLHDTHAIEDIPLPAPEKAPWAHV